MDACANWNVGVVVNVIIVPGLLLCLFMSVVFVVTMLSWLYVLLLVAVGCCFAMLLF